MSKSKAGFPRMSTGRSRNSKYTKALKKQEEEEEEGYGKCQENLCTYLKRFYELF